ncbi:MAG: hypothetical protein WDW38_005791 [Sanguina aurantia]
MAKQIENSVAHNKRAARPATIHVTSFTGALRDYCLEKGAGVWPMQRHEHSTLELFGDRQAVFMVSSIKYHTVMLQVIVLSPDATEALEQLSGSEVYCIGGIVDRSVRRYMSFDYAASQGWGCRRLPILEFSEQLGMAQGVNTRPALNICNAAMALIDYNASGDWTAALSAAIPLRRRRPQVDSKPKQIRATNQAHRGHTTVAEGTAPGSDQEGSPVVLALAAAGLTISDAA